MSKEFLEDTITKIKENDYSWNLYFFRTDKRKNNPFSVCKAKFLDTNYVKDYASNLLDATQKFQINTINDVQEYDGENTKISCDKLELSDTLINEQWNNLFSAVSVATSDKLKGKIVGYILCAEPQNNNDLKPITFIKIANPVIDMNTKKSVVYKMRDTSNELEMFDDDIYRLYLTVDCIIVNEKMYSFNHSFEKIFNIESAMKRKREEVISEIAQIDAFAESDDFLHYAKQYKSHRTFITVKQERIEKIKTKEGREYVSSKLNIPLDENGKFVFQNEKQARNLIKYLCYKIIQDEETKDLLEVGTVVKMEV